MNRRAFLRLFAGAALAPVATHFLPPVGGWYRNGAGLLVPNGSPSSWQTKSPTEIMADVNRMLGEQWYSLTPDMLLVPTKQYKLLQKCVRRVDVRS